jgi:assimilatory nitrate reductase catalytic subunit
MLLTRRSELPSTPNVHWSRVPIEGGHAFALAGVEELWSGDALDDWVTKLFAAASRAELITYADARRGVYRYARIVDGRLDGCLFLAPRRALLPDRATLAPLLGATVANGARIGLLAGKSMDGTSSVDAGRIVCACFAVGFNMLRRTIADQRMTSVGEIGAALRAGTNCGSCIPELNAMLREGQPEMPTPS